MPDTPIISSLSSIITIILRSFSVSVSMLVNHSSIGVAIAARHWLTKRFAP